MTQARSVTCRSCRTWIEDRGRMRRCPNCGAELDAHPLPDLPSGFAASEGLQEPAFPQEQRDDDETAPLSEFIAAGAVLAGLGLLVAGAMLASGAVALVGAVLMFGVTGFFAATRGSLGRTLQHFRTTLWWSVPRRGGDPNDSDRDHNRR